MIKKPCLLFIAFFELLSFYAVAQHSEQDVQLKIRNAKAVHSAVDTDENYVFVFQSSSELQYAFFNSAKQANGNIQIALPSANKKDDVLAVHLQGDVCTMYLHNNNKMTVSKIVVNRTNGQVSTTQLAQLDYTDKFLKALIVNDVFYLLTVSQGQNQIDCWYMRDGFFQRILYPVEMPDLYKRLSNGNDNINDVTNSVVGIDKISYNYENNVKSAQSTKKLYAVDNMIYMVFDDAESTHLVQMDLTEKKASYKQLQFALDKSTSAKRQGNSFLYNHTLFRSTMSMDQLNIAVVRVDSLGLLANYNAYPSFPINFKNGPIVQEGSSDRQKIIDDNNIYFKKVLSSQLSIAANMKDSMYILEVGGYEVYTSNGGYGPAGGGPNISIGMGMGMGMGGMGMGYGGMGMGGMGYGGMGGMGYGYPGYYPYNSTTTSIRTVYFNSLMDSASMNHLPGIVPITMRERISNFQSSVFGDKSPDLIKAVNRENEIIIGFLLPNKITFRTYSFER